MSSESAIQDLLQNFANKAQESQGRVIERCFNSNSESASGFVNCLSKATDRFAEVEKQLGGLIVFAQLSANKAQHEGRDNEYVSQSLHKLLESRLGELSRNIE